MEGGGRGGGWGTINSILPQLQFTNTIQQLHNKKKVVAINCVANIFGGCSNCVANIWGVVATRNLHWPLNLDICSHHRRPGFCS